METKTITAILVDAKRDNHTVASKAGCVCVALTMHYEKFGNNKKLHVVQHQTSCNAVRVLTESGGILSHSSVQHSNACHVGTRGKVVSIDDMYSHIPWQNRFE